MVTRLTIIILLIIINHFCSQISERHTHARTSDMHLYHNGKWFEYEDMHKGQISGDNCAWNLD